MIYNQLKKEKFTINRLNYDLAQTFRHIGQHNLFYNLPLYQGQCIYQNVVLKNSSTLPIRYISHSLTCLIEIKLFVAGINHKFTLTVFN